MLRRCATLSFSLVATLRFGCSATTPTLEPVLGNRDAGHFFSSQRLPASSPQSRTSFPILLPETGKCALHAMIKSFPQVHDCADISAVWPMIRQVRLQTLFHRVCVFSLFSEKRIMEPQLRMENRCDRFGTKKQFKNWRLSRVNCERLVTGILRIGEAAARNGTR